MELHKLGIATIVGVGGWATWVCIQYAAWLQLGFFWAGVAAMVYFANKSKNREL